MAKPAPDVRAAEDEYSRGLLDFTADAVALDAARRVAAVRLDQAQALCKAFSEKEVEARARDAEFARVERYEAARAQADDARRALAEMYPQLAGDLVSLLRVAAEAELAVKAADADLPRNAIPLANVEGNDGANFHDRAIEAHGALNDPEAQRQAGSEAQRRAALVLSTVGCGWNGKQVFMPRPEE
ncbi:MULTISPECIES: hypothetical protein [unclassified Methylobacterium]|uniref:hypothetical protein n=1 Tax=unclassified Methylobacterium TaxID=2615210 RepID=UPI0011CC319B|nr:MULTISPECIES: hypothetical protein [unclassified Methylobacterium]MCJ2009853.1 hypothetical protein [Methylobacterium sp. J-092]TXN72824.1 hypothetical protein FV230_03340 [Methylobacterium sp. WL6]